jgi:nitrous oxide reductase accessory protein NosL
MSTKRRRRDKVRGLSDFFNLCSSHASLEFPLPAGKGVKEIDLPVKISALLFVVLTLFISPVSGAERQFVRPSSKDKCAVCGMFVAKYADWTAEMAYHDGTYVYFDGPKDLFKYLAGMKTYAPARNPGDIAALYVTDYYAVSPFDGFKAFYVMGSDVNGPMGPEFIAFQDVADAREFMKDHRGKRILRFRDITPEVVKTLE